MNIEIHPKYQKLMDKYNMLKDELAIIIERKDYLLGHKRNILEAEYINKIGKYEYQLFQIDIQISRVIRKIQMVQAKINRQEKIDEEKIEKELDKEYKAYMDKLNGMAEDIKIAKKFTNLRILDLEESKELKKLYIEIAKTLHPDLNPNITEKQKILWQRSKEAYEMGDIKLLKIFYEMALDYPSIENMDSMGELNEKIEFFKDEILNISMEIENIQKEFPFNQEELLNNKEQIEEEQENLLAKIEMAKLILEISEEELLLIMPSKNNYLN